VTMRVLSRDSEFRVNALATSRLPLDTYSPQHPPHPNHTSSRSTLSTGDTMADRSACHLFKQTRVNLDWTDKRSDTAIDVHLPFHPGRSGRSLGIIRRRNKRQEPPDTEEKFKLAHHARAASIYYRPVERFPRCILWRLVEDSRVLSVTAVDFTRPESQGEVETTFRFIFPEPIQPSTVGFADAPTRDELVIYALTHDGILYTLNLSPDYLLRDAFLRRNVQPSDFCTTYYPSAFTLHSPHFLLPINHQSLVIPLQDGNVLKLDRIHKSITDRKCFRCAIALRFFSLFSSFRPLSGRLLGKDFQ
jgi:nuclear pore complex protein Nup160